ncbi:MAG: OPT/YSL family transporter [Planctomycetaceae bacterium]|nr:OPT/YSL family transporter [Planctomycetaceae bacterium]
MSSVRLDKELELFRGLMKVPSTFEDGFTWPTFFGSLFIALLMVPGAMYMGLLMGGGSMPAQWVTVILFIEVARRAHKHLKKSELFVLFYMTGAAMGNPFGGLLWNQFFVQSEGVASMGIAEHMPDIWWYAPTDPEVLAQRTFFAAAWWPVIGMIVFQTFIGRIKGTILGYGLFRIASDIEKLPFPMAPVGAQGLMALAEQQTETTEAESVGDSEGKAENWRWRIFSIGGILGLSFGALYAGLPVLSSAVLAKPIIIFPIPFVDWTNKTSDLLPAFATGISLDLGNFLAGMVMPFWAMVGSFVGLIITAIVNPFVLYRLHMLPSWSPGDDTIRTTFVNNIDFYFSFSIGISIAIAIAGFWQVYKSFQASKADAKRQQQMRIQLDAEDAERLSAVKVQRGDIPTPIIIATYVVTSMTYVLMCGWLIDWHPGVMVCLFFFAFLYTPLISYVTARLQGLSGMSVSIPMVREAAFLLSGYTGGIKLWFLPVPMDNFGAGVTFWRQAELTGTKFWSIWKSEILLTPIILLSSIFFAQFIWSLAEVPGPEYPYAQKMWEMQAANQCIMYTATLGRFSQFNESFRWDYIGYGTGVATLLFAVLYGLKLPILLIYGVLGGLNQTTPHGVLPQFIGALIGRYYFQRRYGEQLWRQYIPVVCAGFGCGIGLITIFCLGVKFLAESVIKIPF